MLTVLPGEDHDAAEKEISPAMLQFVTRCRPHHGAYLPTSLLALLWRTSARPCGVVRTSQVDQGPVVGRRCGPNLHADDRSPDDNRRAADDPAACAGDHPSASPCHPRA